MLGDEALALICGMLPPDGAKSGNSQRCLCLSSVSFFISVCLSSSDMHRSSTLSGLRELTLSANPGISSTGWARLAIAVAHSSQLRVLNLDYNPLGSCSTHHASLSFFWLFSGSKCSRSLCR